MTQPTTERLANALAHIDGLPAHIIVWARKGRYDDYKSESPFPLNDLVRDLTRTGIPEAIQFCDRVKAGEFDGTKAEAAAWLASDEGQQAYRKLSGKFPGPGQNLGN
jgi:hypothetical protein